MSTISLVGAGGNSAVWCQIFADIPGLVEYEQVFEPRPAARPVCDASYQTFLEIHKRVRPLCRRIAGGVQ